MGTNLRDISLFSTDPEIRKLLHGSPFVGRPPPRSTGDGSDALFNAPDPGQHVNRAVLRCRGASVGRRPKGPALRPKRHGGQPSVQWTSRFDEVQEDCGPPATPLIKNKCLCFDWASLGLPAPSLRCGLRVGDASRRQTGVKHPNRS